MPRSRCLLYIQRYCKRLGVTDACPIVKRTERHAHPCEIWGEFSVQWIDDSSSTETGRNALEPPNRRRTTPTLKTSAARPPPRRAGSPPPHPAATTRRP